MQSTKGRMTKATESANDEMAGEVEALKSSFNHLRNDVVDLFHHAFGIGRSGATAATDSATDAMEHLKEKFAEFNERGADQLAAFGKKIAKNPVQSALIAFGAGYIAAKFFSRR